MEASLAGKPTAVRTKRVVTAPVAGIPAAPMLDTADVTLHIKHRYCPHKTVPKASYYILLTNMNTCYDDDAMIFLRTGRVTYATVINWLRSRLMLLSWAMKTAATTS